MSHLVELCNWTASLTPDRKEVVLSGKVLNHPTMPDYADIHHTSPVCLVYGVDQRFVAVTRNNTHYRLGVSNAEWATRHPNGRRDFIHHFHLEG